MNAELQTIYYGLEEVWSNGFRSVICELDRKPALSLIGDGVQPTHPYAPIIINRAAYNLDHQLFGSNLDPFNIGHRFITKILEGTRFIVDNPSNKLMQNSKLTWIILQQIIIFCH